MTNIWPQDDCLQLGPKKTVSLSLIEERWTDVALPKEQFDELVRIGSFGGDVEWFKFFALASSALGEVSTHIVHTTVACIIRTKIFMCLSSQIVGSFYKQ